MQRLSSTSTTYARVRLLTACAVLTLGACGGGGGGGVEIGDGQEPDPVVLDFPVAYVKRPLVLDTRGGYKDYFRGHLPNAHHLNFDTLRGTDNGERINISGFGNIEPYVPHFYLGVAQMNLKDCQAAMVNWNISEKDGSIQKTSLYGSLKDYRAQCSKY